MRSIYARLHRRYGHRIPSVERQSHVKEKLRRLESLPSMRSSAGALRD